EPVGGAERLLVAREPWLGPDVLERLLDAAPVAHPVVDDADHAVSVPFVLGTPVSVGSMAIAARSARAKALNSASIMWCAFVPASSVRWTVSFAFETTARKNSSASSWSKPPVAPGGSAPAEKTSSGRPETSIAHLARAS